MKLEYTLLSDDMIFLLKYHYGLKKPNIVKENNALYIKEQKNKYVLYKIENENEFSEIIKLLNSQQKKLARVVPTIDNRMYIYYQNKMYALIEIIKEDDSYHSLLVDKAPVSNIEDYQSINRSNWYFLWCNKVDYFHTMEYEKKREKTNEISDYYIGIAETAIQYYNIAKKNTQFKEQLYVSHKRIKEHMNRLPANIVIDRRERDVAEYIKHLIVSCKYSDEINNNIMNIISKENLNPEYIFARILFPTYYFDIYEEENNKKITIEQINKYEKSLKKIYKQISKIKKIKKIDWL